MSAQAQMKATLAETGIAHKEIKCYGRQIVVTCWSRDAANKWQDTLSKFSKVRGVIQAIDENQDQAAWFRDHPNIGKKTATHEVWRVFATIQ